MGSIVWDHRVGDEAKTAAEPEVGTRPLCRPNRYLPTSRRSCVYPSFEELNWDGRCPCVYCGCPPPRGQKMWG